MQDEYLPDVFLVTFVSSCRTMDPDESTRTFNKSFFWAVSSVCVFGYRKFPTNQNMDPGDPNILERPTFPAPFEKYTRTTEEDIWDNDLHQEEKMKVEVRRGIICQIIVDTIRGGGP